MNEKSFKFLNYDFNEETFTAIFSYEDINNNIYTEKIHFQKPEKNEFNKDVLDRALFLAFVLIGVSYYKTFPTKSIVLKEKLDNFQSNFFNHVYQEGLAQYAFENNLHRDDLAHFTPEKPDENTSISYVGSGIISLQSGGKDSLLSASILKEKNLSFSSLYVSSGDSYPKILDKLSSPLILIKREVDLETLKKAGGKNGHIPITYIIQSIALIQGILLNKNTIITSIGQEGNENHAFIDDLPVNHQWSKTWEAEQLFSEYIHRYISENLNVGSILRPFTELAVAKMFVEKCWQKFGHSFSSCNVANYSQKKNNETLSWCGNCAKCANTFLLFMPFLNSNELESIFKENLLEKKSLNEIFKGLLGIDGVIKPFECVGEIDELRKAYEMRKPNYGNLPFEVPVSNFDYLKKRQCQKFIEEI